MTILIKLKVGLNSNIQSPKLLLKNFNLDRISSHKLKEAQVEIKRNLYQDLALNNLKLNQVVKKHGNQFLQVKDIVIQNYHLVLRTLETVSTFIFNLICYIYSLLFCIINASSLSFTKHTTKDT